MEVQDSEYRSNGVLSELHALHRRAFAGSTAPLR
jgi:hypothetical protein